MKKVVLAATTALVAAGSAAALEVTLGGQVSTLVEFDGTNWSNATIGGDDDDGVSLTVSGESMGWTYGASADLMDGTFGDVSLGSAGIGSITLSTTGIEWSGMNVAGFDVSVSTSLANIEAATFGISGSLGGIAVSGDIENNAGRTFDLDLGTAVAGASVGISVAGDLNDTSSVAYGIELGMSSMGADLTISINEVGAVDAAGDPAHTIGVEAAMGALTLSTELVDGDAFNNLSLAYSAELAEGLTLDASVTGGASTTMSIGTTLSF